MKPGRAASCQKLPGGGQASPERPAARPPDGVDRPRLAEPANGPDEDHLVPLDRPRRRALGRLGRVEQVGGGAQPDRNRAQRIR
jgi:hypothetical protein